MRNCQLTVDSFPIERGKMGRKVNWEFSSSEIPPEIGPGNKKARRN